MPSIRPGEEDYKVRISNEIFLINDNLNLNLTFGAIAKEDFKCPETSAGVCGLIRGTNGFKNLEDKYLLINQLYDLKIISKKLFYISPYYKDNTLLSESKIIIGSYPEEFNLNGLPYCDLDDTYSSNYFDCRLNGIIIEDSDSTITRHISIKDKHYIARFEEGSIQANNLPDYLYPVFEDIFINKKGCKLVDNFFDCSEVPDAMQNFTLSYVFGKYKYVFNTASLWVNNKFFFKFPNDKNNTILVFSTFSGNYHRIYSMDDKKIYFSGYNNQIVEINEKNNTDVNNSDNNKKDGQTDSAYNEDSVKTWKIITSVVIVVLVIVIIIFVIILVTKRKHKKDLQDIAKISFKNDNDKKENNGKI